MFFSASRVTSIVLLGVWSFMGFVNPCKLYFQPSIISSVCLHFSEESLSWRATPFPKMRLCLWATGAESKGSLKQTTELFPHRSPSPKQNLRLRERSRELVEDLFSLQCLANNGHVMGLAVLAQAGQCP